MTDKKDFTHYGWFYGIVPVYVDMTEPECPVVECRHWTIEPLMLAVELVTSLIVMIGSMIHRDFEPMFSIKLTGRIDDEDHQQ